MKIRQKWLVFGLMLITVGLISASVCFAQDSAADNDRQSQRGQGRQMMPGGRGMGPGREMGPGQRSGPGMGQRPGGGMVPGGGRWGGIMGVDEEELLMFLNKHESRLAARLKGLQKSSPDEYREQLSTLSRLYGPVIRQMEMNPEMGRLSLDKIRLSLRIKELVQESKIDGADLPKIKQTLKLNVTKQFDIIIDQEKRTIKQARERLEMWAGRVGEPSTGDAGGRGRGMGRGTGRGMDRGTGRGTGRGVGRGVADVGRGVGRGPADVGTRNSDLGGGRGRGTAETRGLRRGSPEIRGPGRGVVRGPVLESRGRGEVRGRGRGWGQVERIEQFSKQLEQKNKTIETWVKKKEEIVNKRIEILLAGLEEFPW